MKIAISAIPACLAALCLAACDEGGGIDGTDAGTGRDASRADDASLVADAALADAPRAGDAALDAGQLVAPLFRNPVTSRTRRSLARAIRILGAPEASGSGSCAD